MADSGSTDDIKERLRQIALNQEFVSKTDKQYFGKKYTGDREDDRAPPANPAPTAAPRLVSKDARPEPRKTKTQDDDDDEDVKSSALAAKLQGRRNSFEDDKKKERKEKKTTKSSENLNDEGDDKKVSKKSTKVSFADDTKDQDEVEEEDTTIEIKSGYRMAVPTSSILKKTSKWRSFALKKRLQWFEKVMIRMRDPVDGLTFKSGGNWAMFDSTPDSVNGVELAEWYRTTFKVLDPQEANKAIQGLIDYGYIIPLDIEQIVFVENQNTLYTYQIEFFFYSNIWKISDEDYLNYLYRKQGAKLINEEESQILANLVRKMNNPAKMVSVAAETQKAIAKLTKKEKKLFDVREAAFWRTQMPLSDSKLYVSKEWKSTIIKRYTREQYRKNIKSRTKLLKDLEDEIQYLTANLSVYRLSVSTSSKNLISRTTLFQQIDPILSPENVQKSNWLRSEDQEWKDYRIDSPTVHHVKVWCNSFFDLYNDQLGLIYFNKFLEKDLSTENLKFCRAVEALDNISTRDDFFIVARKIVDEFIRTNSQNEINIVVQHRKPIIEMIEAGPKQISYDIFYDAYHHIYHLMQTASFPRFVASDIVKDLLK